MAAQALAPEGLRSFLQQIEELIRHNRMRRPSLAPGDQGRGKVLLFGWHRTRHPQSRSPIMDDVLPGCG